MDHTCNRGCGRSIYVFKALAVARKQVARKFLGVEEQRGQSDKRTKELVGVNARSDRLLRQQSASTSSEEVGDPYEYLDVADEVLRTKIISEWQDQMSTNALALKSCAVCAKMSSSVSMQEIAVAEVDLKLLRNDMLPSKTWPTSYNFRAYDRAILCSAGLSDLNKPVSMFACHSCIDSLGAGEMPKFAMANDLYYGHEALPPHVREAFEQSTVFERMLICRVRYNSVSCRFKASEFDPNEEEEVKKYVLRNQRKGVRGNVIVTPLDVVRLNDVLPPSPEVIRDTMSVIYVGSVPPTRQTITRLSPVLVRKSRVKIMIEFLLEHNPHYGTLEGFKGYSPDNLNALFDGKDSGKDQAVPSAVHIGHLVPNDAVGSATADYTRRNVDDATWSQRGEEVLMENVGFTLGDDSAESYWDMKMMALQRCLTGKSFLAYRRGSAAVPDFDNPYLLSLAFPEEDPWGIGGMLHPFRRKKVSVGDQVGHLLSVHGGRFQRHSEFAFFYYNVLRKQLVSTNMRYKSPTNSYKAIIDKMLGVDVEKLAALKEKCKRNPLFIPVDEEEKEIMTIMNSVSLIARHVPGSAGYKVKLRNEIRGMINYRGAPALFLTLNPSDIDNPIVRLLAGHDIDLEDIGRGEDMDEWSCKVFAARNPAPCALFFDLIVTKFISIILRYGRAGKGLFG
ncbi:hypothetical protein C8R44DRAFT_608789, partial [Mycena epipterygia]